MPAMTRRLTRSPRPGRVERGEVVPEARVGLRRARGIGDSDAADAGAEDGEAHRHAGVAVAFDRSGARRARMDAQPVVAGFDAQAEARKLGAGGGETVGLLDADVGDV